MKTFKLFSCLIFATVIAIPFYDDSTSVYYELRSHVPLRISSIKNNLLETIKKHTSSNVILSNSRNDTILKRIFGYRSPNGCTCQELTCGCCTGFNFPQFNFNRDGCMNFTYDPHEFAIAMNMLVDNNSVFTNKISAQNPPPLCIPVPIPYFPLGVDFCAKVFEINTANQKLHMCLDFETRVQSATVLILHFDCMDMGADGVSLVKPGGSVGSPGSGIAPTFGILPTEPPQIGSDIYDEVTEVKRNITKNKLKN